MAEEEAASADQEATAKSQTPLKPSGGTGQIEAQRNVPAKFPGG